MSKLPVPALPVEKGQHLPRFAPARQEPARCRLRTGFCVLLTALCAGLTLYTFAPQCAATHFSIGKTKLDFVENSDLCPQPNPLVPSTNGELWKELSKKYSSEEFLHDAVEWLGGAVRVP